MLRALSKSGPQLLATLADTSINSRTDGTKEKLQELIGVAQGCPSTFDETSMFSGPSSEVSSFMVVYHEGLLIASVSRFSRLNSKSTSGTSLVSWIASGAISASSGENFK